MLPVPDECLEIFVHLDVLSSQVAHLLHIDLLKQSTDVDALDQLVDLNLELRVIQLEFLVLLDQVGVVHGENFLLGNQSLLS